MKDGSPAGKAPSLPWWLRILAGKRPGLTLIRSVILIGCSWIWFTQIWLPIRVKGHSMEPTYREGHLGLVNAWAYRWHQPQRGDIVSIEFIGREALLLKRIIGLPGERVAIKQGVVYINGRPLDEPYVKNQRAPWRRPEVRLAVDEFFVIGDNREMPNLRDHTLGEVPARRIVGKVIF